MAGYGMGGQFGIKPTMPLGPALAGEGGPGVTGNTWGGFGAATEGIGSWLNQNPEQFAIFADKLGQGFDPNNAAAGIGTMFGQSSLADKANKEQQFKNEQFQQQLIQALGGNAPQQQPSASPGQGSNLPETGNETTAKGQAGVDSVSYTDANDDTGGRYKTTKEYVPGNKTPGNGSINMTDAMPFLNA